jgi:membrane fusion protein (multidrug efflux system)
MNIKIIYSIAVSIVSGYIFLSCDAQDSKSAAGDSSEKTDRLVPVEAMIVRLVNVEQNVSLTGVLEPVHAVDLMSEVSGKVVRINKNIGDVVDTKDVIAVLDDNVPRNNYEHAKAQVLSAETNLKITRLNLQSDEDLFNNGDISELEYQNSLLTVKTAEANYQSALASLSMLEKTYNDTRIISPITGLISRKYVDLGTMVTINMPVYRVVDLSNLKLNAGVSQEVISRVKSDNQAEITISGLNNRKFTGYVKRISPQADEQTGAFMVEIHVKNTPDYQIKAGMTAKADLHLREDINRLALPDYAVVSKSGSSYAYRIKNNRAYLTQLDIGETVGGHLVINDGISAGDTIVVVGMKNLGVETPVIIEILHE